jgi:hypothetical protein
MSYPPGLSGSNTASALRGVRGARVPAMKKYRHSLSYRLATKRHGFIEEHMLISRGRLLQSLLAALPSAMKSARDIDSCAALGLPSPVDMTFVVCRASRLIRSPSRCYVFHFRDVPRPAARR